MGGVISNILLKRKGIPMILLLLSSLFISENVFSRKHWDRNMLKISYDKTYNTINITCLFVDFEFGPRGEHGYLEWGNFYYSTDDLGRTKLMRSQYTDRNKEVWAWVEFRDKMIGAKIDFIGLPYDRTINWVDIRKIEHMLYIDSSYKICFSIKWYLPSCLNITNILFTGKWHVSGLNCSDDIPVLTYKIQDGVLQGSEEITDSKNNNGDLPDNLYPEKLTVKVYKELDFAVISGVPEGDDIKVYTISGLLINSTPANSDIVRIKLTKNQFYLFKTGQVCYKLAL